MKFIWKYFNKFNLCNLLRLIYIGRAKISIVFFFFFNKEEKRDFITVLWPRCGQIKWMVNHFKQNIFHTLWVFSVPQSCLTLCDPMDCNPPGSSVPGIFQQEYWRRLPFPIPGDLPDIGIELTSVSFVSCVVRQILYHCTTSDAPSILSCFHSFENTSLY